MQPYKITLIGHRDIYEYRKIRDGLNTLLRLLMHKKPYLEIYLGRNGDFDLLATSVVRKIQDDCGRAYCAMTLVLPYTLANMDYYERHYDSIFIPEFATRVHPKNAITLRNRWMVEECDLFVCYVEHPRGGANQALKYAKKLRKQIINLASNEDLEKIYDADSI